MQGFDPKFRDFPDYIATLHRYYSPDIVVRSPASIVVGNQSVIGATMATLAEFPDRTLLGEDVIWSGAPETGMLSSHRLFSTATHTGDGAYGPATGRKLSYRIIADCHAINNQINDEWLIRDQGAIVRQMGWEPMQFARDQIAREGGPDLCTRPLTPTTDLPGPYMGTGNDNAWGANHADILTRIMAADFGVIPQAYDRACQLEYPGGLTAHGPAAADRLWMSLRAAFPDAIFTIHHQIGRDDLVMPPRSAIRWSLHGKHSGWGAFGPPTGAQVYVLGMSHVEFGSWGLRREYTLFDETAVWKQILLHTGAL
jgi:predicted ester cyclase